MTFWLLLNFNYNSQPPRDLPTPRAKQPDGLRPGHRKKQFSGFTSRCRMPSTLFTGQTKGQNKALCPNPKVQKVIRAEGRFPGRRSAAFRPYASSLKFVMQEFSSRSCSMRQNSISSLTSSNTRHTPPSKPQSRS